MRRTEVGWEGFVWRANRKCELGVGLESKRVALRWSKERCLRSFSRTREEGLLRFIVYLRGRYRILFRERRWRRGDERAMGAEGRVCTRAERLSLSRNRALTVADESISSVYLHLYELAAFSRAAPVRPPEIDRRFRPCASVFGRCCNLVRSTRSFPSVSPPLDFAPLLLSFLPPCQTEPSVFHLFLVTFLAVISISVRGIEVAAPNDVYRTGMERGNDIRGP